MTVLIAAYSMVTLAASTKPVGDLTVSGNILPNDAAVTVNGEPAQTGRTIFDSSTVVTPETSGAVLNLGKAGRVDVGAGSTFVVNVAGDLISGDLTAGSITVLNSAEAVNIRILSGDTVSLNAGESVNAVSGKAVVDHRDANGKCIDDNNNGKEECGSNIPGWVWAAIVGGVVAGVIIAVSASSKDSNSVSPVR
ncbi:MAG: hypothetical protein ABJB40_13375 [Acidobacteriota bacterium]